MGKGLSTAVLTLAISDAVSAASAIHEYPVPARMARFNPKIEVFTVYPLPSRGARVRQILGRPGEVWLPESGRWINWRLFGSDAAKK